MFDTPEDPPVRSWGELKFWKEYEPLVWAEIEKRSEDRINPTKTNVYRALDLTPLDKVRVVILGQDPYPNPANAMGLAFSVPEAASVPGSLVNVFLELQADLGCKPSGSGDLSRWAERGVLLLNTILTCESWMSMSHQDVGWQKLTDEVIATVLMYRQNVVFILWGNQAMNSFQRVNKLHPGFLNRNNHAIIRSVHPSGRAAYLGFFGSKPFSRTNQFFRKIGQPEIDWSL